MRPPLQNRGKGPIRRSHIAARVLFVAQRGLRPKRRGALLEWVVFPIDDPAHPCPNERM